MEAQIILQAFIDSFPRYPDEDSYCPDNEYYMNELSESTINAIDDQLTLGLLGALIILRFL
jgi:hypothetical protein